MEFKDIMAISGRPGLYKFIAQGRNSVIVENLETGKRISAFTTERMSSFEEISVFTHDGDVPLAEVLKKISEKLNGEDAPSPKSSPEALKDFFVEILPEYDQDRVYFSDIKKVVQWYTVLQKLQLLQDLLTAREAEEEPAAADAPKEPEAKDNASHEEQEKKEDKEDSADDKR